MTAPGEPSRRARVALAGSFGALLAAGFLLHLAVASRLPIDYYDATDYLINARYWAGHGSWLEGVRPPLPSLLQAPLFLGGATAPWTGPHLLATVLSYASLAVCFAMFVCDLSPLRALAATLILAGSRLFAHYAPFVMADLLGMGIVAGVLRCHLRDRARPRGLAWVGTTSLATLAIATRHPLAILGPFLLGFEVLEALREKRVTPPLRKPTSWVAAILPIPLFIVAMAVLFQLRLGWDLRQTLASLGEMVASQASKSGITTRVAESRVEYLEAIVAAFHWPVALLMLGGTFAAVARGSAADRLHALWFVANLALYSLVITRRESRYLLPALPSAVYLAVRALKRLERWLPPGPLAGWRPKGVAALRALLWVAAVAPLIPGVATEASAFRDPVYREPFLARAAGAVGALRRDPGRILVLGDKYALHPQRYVFTEGDEYYYFHHIAARTFHYFLNQEVGQARAPVPDDRHLRLPGLLDWAAPGDVLVALEPDTYNTRLQPSRKRPLRIARVWAERVPRDAEGGCDAFRAKRALVELCRSAAGISVAVASATPVELYVPNEGRYESRGWYAPGAARAGFVGPVPGELYVTGYDAAVALCPPDPRGIASYSLEEGTWPGPGACPLLWRP